MKRVLIVFVCLLLAAGVAYAKYEDAKEAVEMFKPITEEGRAYFESFEGTTFPPTGWTAVITNPGYTWHRYVGTAAHGTAFANCLYDPAFVPQDEKICFTYTIAAGDQCLCFYAMASIYWAITPYQNYNTYVYINGVEKWNFRTNQTGTTSYQWLQYCIPLSGYGVGQQIEVCFRYAGVDGAQAGFDAISIGACPVVTVCPFQYPCHIIDFNAGPNGWTSLACGTGPIPWQWGVPTIGVPTTACDGVPVTNVLATNLTGVYPVLKGEAAVIGPYVLPPWCRTLELCHFYDYESNYDGGNVKISTDGGSTWTLIEPVSGYTTTLTSTSYPAQCVWQQKVFSGTSTTFIRSCFNISAYSGQTIKIGFFSGSDSYATTDYGWYIKWVKLGTDQEPSPVENTSWGTIKAMYR